MSDYGHISENQSPDEIARQVEDAQEFRVAGHGYEVTITRSAGADGAVVIFVDGPEDVENPPPATYRADGAPGCRILLNDEPVWRGTPFKPREDDL